MCACCAKNIKKLMICMRGWDPDSESVVARYALGCIIVACPHNTNMSTSIVIGLVCGIVGCTAASFLTIFCVCIYNARKMDNDAHARDDPERMPRVHPSPPAYTEHTEEASGGTEGAGNGDTAITTPMAYTPNQCIADGNVLVYVMPCDVHRADAEVNVYLTRMLSPAVTHAVLQGDPITMHRTWCVPFAGPLGILVTCSSPCPLKHHDARRFLLYAPGDPAIGDHCFSCTSKSARIIRLDDESSDDESSDALEIAAPSRISVCPRTDGTERGWSGVRGEWRVERM